VIVGDRKGRAVRMFDEFGGDVGHWDATSFNWICGIGVLPNNNLAIYDRERCKIGVYSSPGELIREFSSFGSNDSQICMADFIAVDGKQRILIADSGNHCVKAFDSNTGAFVGKFGARGVGDGCLDWPKGICVDAADNVIVTDVYNNRVSMFAPDGQFVRHLITDILNPYSVCYSQPTASIGLTQYSLDGGSQYDVYAL
jgi:NHL repeat